MFEQLFDAATSIHG